ncbi:hypothetical protein O7631_17295 [Micromonospora sp. WMMD967]|uniref:hypothetical protein n=1 Tax=Micromonospora sp. WMMD967 TaxID=3016101 RepID=UPI00241701C1|nr:hypothetical protein [Micromonospora sp. WMMD967]MDG4838276.1 hypothetical protein [Micromonospora sp. WMMD967]
MFWDIVGVGTLLDEILTWLAQRVADIIDALWSLLSSAFLVVPDVTGLPQVQTISARALMIVNTCFVLAIIACGIVIMGRDSVQARYGVGELAPRLVIGFIAANFATPLSKGLIELGNALTQALTSDSVATDGSLAQMKRTVVDALTNPANALLTLIIGIAIATLVAMIMVGWILRLGLLVILVGIAPVALACHATPWTEPAAKLWWRAFIGALATVIAQALALHTALTVFLSPTANLPALGLPNDPTGTFNLFIICCLLLAVVKIPALMRRYVTGGQSNNVVGAFIRVAIVQQVSRALTGGLWRGGRQASLSAGRVAARQTGPGGPGTSPSLPRPTGGGPRPGPVPRRTAPTAAPAPAERALPQVPSGRTPATAMPQRMPRWRRWWAYTDSGTGWPTDSPDQGMRGTSRPPHGSGATPSSIGPGPASAHTPSGTGWPSTTAYGPRTARASAAARSQATSPLPPTPSSRPSARRNSTGNGLPA